ncbi:anion permease [Rahnella sp. BCC 1045]|jgi:Na+/H+ antiporter NhaD/arsenite permease-like protein|uniref:SLC13 family permease n=1 Tax=Rahnella sp. BCC 1045 TaxID=2816251 RepID=UPI001C2742D3|nr:SLC13 family permease [Rahnella sp. BCC 1045]MBU9822516.1 anion permease [Rahnella sp. BCC 1045]
MLITAFSTVFKPFLRDRFLHLLVLLGVALTLFQTEKIMQFPLFVDWDTIITLLGLLMLTKGVEVSGYFDFVGRKMINAIDNERRLALFLVMAAAVLSTFMTNDVALFIVIPLTITLKKLTSLPVTRLIIFEALAVNAGSLLTPIGNPQNILLWNKSGQSFLHFIGQMAPLALVTLVALLIVTGFCFPSRSLKKTANNQGYPFQKRLLASCGVLYVVFIACVDLGLALYGLLAVILCFLLLARKVLLRIDWPLILVFIVMFIDVRLIVGLDVLQPVFARINGLPDYGHYLLSIGLSQVISNVPATILMINYLPSGPLLAYAVNAGGFGLAMGSLANLIALRMANDRKIWLKFHFYSFPFLLFSGLTGWSLLPLVS